MKEFSNRFIKVTHRPVMIVGECPGKQRKKDQNFEVFHGNRTGDFVEKAIKGFENIILTNAINTLKPHIYHDVLVGRQELEGLIIDYNPCKIICLGNKAADTIWFLKSQGYGALKHKEFSHPSYVLRFNLGIDDYFNKLRNEITESLQHN